MTIPNYEQMLEDFYTRFLRDGDRCIDVGAHVGRHSIPMAHCVAPSGKVYAFEPLPGIFNQLKTRVEEMGLSSIISTRQCALSDAGGDADFVLVHEAPEYSGLRPRHYDMQVTTERIRVQTSRLDDLFETKARAIRYIKIDCEGGELGVLRGASDLLRRDRPVVSFECGDSSLEAYDYDSGEIYDFFAAHDYNIRSITQLPLDRAAFIVAASRQEYWDYLADPR